MDFSKLGLGRQLDENVDPLKVVQGTRDNALTAGERLADEVSYVG